MPLSVDGSRDAVSDTIIMAARSFVEFDIVFDGLSEGELEWLAVVAEVYSLLA